MTLRESDQPIVLGDGRAVHRGKGLAGIRSLQRKHLPDMQGRIINANLPAGNSPDDLRVILRKRVFLKSPVREFRTPGSVRGEGGQLPSLPQRAPSKLGVSCKGRWNPENIDRNEKGKI